MSKFCYFDTIVHKDYVCPDNWGLTACGTLTTSCYSGPVDEIQTLKLFPQAQCDKEFLFYECKDGKLIKGQECFFRPNGESVDRSCKNYVAPETSSSETSTATSTATPTATSSQEVLPETVLPEEVLPKNTKSTNNKSVTNSTTTQNEDNKSSTENENNKSVTNSSYVMNNKINYLYISMILLCLLH